MRSTTCMTAVSTPLDPICESEDACCALLVVVCNDASPAFEGVAVHHLYGTRMEPTLGTTRVCLGDWLWVVAPEASLPAQLAGSLPYLAAVVPRTATMVRDRRTAAAEAAKDTHNPAVSVWARGVAVTPLSAVGEAEMSQHVTETYIRFAETSLMVAALPEDLPNPIPSIPRTLHPPPPPVNPPPPALGML